jgi:hypothetical protein
MHLKQLPAKSIIRRWFSDSTELASVILTTRAKREPALSEAEGGRKDPCDLSVAVAATSFSRASIALDA